MGSSRSRSGAGYAPLILLLWLALLPSPARAQQQTTVLQLGTSALSARPGQSVTLSYRWNAVPMAEDYEAFVHFVDANGVQQTWSGDHAPPTGTSVWSGAVSYSRTVSIPASAALGTYTIRIGLYQRHSPWGRVALGMGPGVTTDGYLRYTVGTLTVREASTELLQLANPSLSAQPGQGVTLGMRWNAVPQGQDYYAFVHFVDANGVQHGSFNADHLPPVPTSTWSGPVAYDVSKSVPSNLAPGQYTIRAGLYPMSAPSNRVTLTPGPGVTADNETRYIIGTLTVGGTPPPSGGPLGQDASQYVLTFSDEFESGFDTGKWNEAIWYEQDETEPEGPQADDNYAVSGGSLRIWPQRNGDGSFTNRTLDTDGKFEQTYGYFEMQAKLPIGKGVWPAFWLYAHPGDARPEIDIMEAYPGGGPDSGWGDANLHPVNYGMTLHKANADYSYHDIPYATKLRDFAPYEGGVDLSAAFHTYAVKWEPSGITFYFDGQQVGPKYQDTAGYYNRPMYVLLDVWFGSASGTPDATTPTGPGNSFEVRYVRVWQFKPVQAQAVDYYGDSTVWGYKTHEGGRVAKPAPAVFAESLSGVQVRNEGVSGSTACGLLNGTDGVHPAWSTQLASSNATTVIINHAINDQWTYGLSTYKSCLTGLVQGAKSRGKRVIFETPNPTRDSGGGLETYVAAMKEVAAQQQVPVIDQYQYLLGYLNGRSPYVICPDGLHPTEEVYGMKGRYAASVFRTLP